jgi:hypothetical protein
MAKNRLWPKLSTYKVLKVENLHRILIFGPFMFASALFASFLKFIFIQNQNLCSLASILISKSFLFSKNFEAVRE